MHLDFDQYDAKEIYGVLAALVVPRPIAWVSTVGGGGLTNIAPYSFFNVMGVRPPIVAFAPGNKANGEPKDTPRNIAESGEFVVNLVEEAHAPKMVVSAKPHAAGVSEIDLLALPTVDSIAIAPPRIASAAISMECRLVQTLEIGQNRMIIGQVLHLHARDGILDPETLQMTPGSFSPIGRLGSPDNYCRTTDSFQLS